MFMFMNEASDGSYECGAYGDGNGAIQQILGSSYASKDEIMNGEVCLAEIIEND